MNAFRIDPIAKTFEPFCFEWHNSENVRYKNLIRMVATTENLPHKHYFAAAKILGAESPMHVAPYMVEHKKNIRTFVWVMDNIGDSNEGTVAAKKLVPGFTVCSHPGKWIGVGILVQYGGDNGKTVLAFDDKVPKIRWIAPGEGK